MARMTNRITGTTPKRGTSKKMRTKELMKLGTSKVTKGINMTTKVINTIADKIAQRTLARSGE